MSASKLLKWQLRSRKWRSLSLRRFDKHSSLPRLKGGVVAHIMDFSNDESLEAQLLFLRLRDVKTFRIYTTRPSEVEAIRTSTAELSSSSCHIIPISPRETNTSVYKLVDNYNFALRPDVWSIVLKAGEFLLYPFVASRTIADLCKFLFDETRFTFFALRLDAYPLTHEANTLSRQPSDWGVDRFGYHFAFDRQLQMDLWAGGFLQRFTFPPTTPWRDNFTNLSRIPMMRAGRRRCHGRDFVSVLPPHLNQACSAWHLSPTGCIVSAHAYQSFKAIHDGHATAPNSEEVWAKLRSAPHLRLNWKHEQLVDAGLMNLGQWL